MNPVGCSSCLLASGSRGLPDFPQALPLLTDCLERLAMQVADLPHFLCESPEPLRFVPSELG